MNSTISIVKHKQVFGKQGWHAIFSSTNQLGFPYALLSNLHGDADLPTFPLALDIPFAH
jgi:hypothetical protein